MGSGGAVSEGDGSGPAQPDDSTDDPLDALDRGVAPAGCRDPLNALRGQLFPLNAALSDAASREPHAPTSSVFRLWVADNHAMDGDYSNAVRAYDDCIDPLGQRVESRSVRTSSQAR